MEPIAVNRITVTDALFAESHAAVFSRRRRKMLLYAGIVFLAFGLALLAAQSRLPAASGLGFPALLTGMLVIIWALTLEKTELRRKYRVYRRRNGEAAQRTVACYPRHLTVEGGGQPVDIDYADIREHRQTEHLLLLLCADHTGVMLARDGFETGSAEALLSAIEKARAEAAELM